MSAVLQMLGGKPATPCVAQSYELPQSTKKTAKQIAQHKCAGLFLEKITFNWDARYKQCGQTNAPTMSYNKQRLIANAKCTMLRMPTDFNWLGGFHSLKNGSIQFNSIVLPIFRD